MKEQDQQICILTDQRCGAMTGSFNICPNDMNNMASNRLHCETLRTSDSGVRCHVIHIVRAYVERSRHCTTTLVGEDTDLLILLLHYSRTDNEIIYSRSDANK